MGKGLVLVQRKLDFDGLNESERAVCLKSLENTVIDRHVMQTARDKGEQKGRQEGRQEGIAEATRQDILRALSRDRLTVDEIADLLAVPVVEMPNFQQNAA